MGLFDMFKKKAEPVAAAAPASISASAGADVLCSPVKGKVIKMADVPDPVFGGEVLGKGCAVCRREFNDSPKRHVGAFCGVWRRLLFHHHNHYVPAAY